MKKDKIIMFPGDKIRFLTDILRKQIDLRNQLESRANVTMGFSATIVAFTMNYFLQGKETIGSVIIMFASMLAILSSLFSLKPPKLFSRKGQKQSVFYHTAISSVEPDKYIASLQKITSNEKTVIEQYGLEIYNLTKHSIHYKKLFAHLAIQILVVGLIVGTVVTIWQWI
jgi:hypothetical protein